MMQLIEERFHTQTNNDPFRPWLQPLHSRIKQLSTQNHRDLRALLKQPESTASTSAEESRPLSMGRGPNSVTDHLHEMIKCKHSHLYRHAKSWRSGLALKHGRRSRRWTTQFILSNALGSYIFMMQLIEERFHTQRITIHSGSGCNLTIRG
jgi:hypothetical protein